MTISEYLADSIADLPAPGTTGIENDWLPVTTLFVTHGSLWAGDPHTVDAEQGVLIEVPNGQYAFEAKGMDFAGRRAVSRIRASPIGVQAMSLGRHIGDTGTDTGMIAVCDLRALNNVVQEQGEVFQETVMNHSYQLSGEIHVAIGPGFDLPYVAVAFGDTGAKAFELQSDDSCVGFELEFLASDYTYDDYG